LIALYIIFVFVVFILGIFLGVSFSTNRRRSRGRPIAAEGGPRRDGKERSANLLAVVAGLIVVSGVVVLDHFKEPLFLNWPPTRPAISVAQMVVLIVVKALTCDRIGSKGLPE
jgi:hypothetical protein